MNEFLYFLYYLKSTPRKEFVRYLNFTKQRTGKSKIQLLTDIFISSFKHKISFMDYFYFRFSDLDKIERRKWAGTGFMYEYQLKMNPKSTRDILEDKIQFLEKYHEFVERNWISVSEILKQRDYVNTILQNDSGKIVVKNSKGQVGREVKILNSEEFSIDSLYSYMESNNYDLLEEAVIQHPVLMAMSPTGLNTIRIITQIKNMKGNDFAVEILGARLRVSVNSPVDNMGAGNFAAAVDSQTGIIISDGVFSDITKDDVKYHPVTKIPIKDFLIPNWNLVLDCVTKAALKHPQNRSIGWDVAVKEDSVELIEGNHNWCKLLYQLPVRKGLKKELKKWYDN